MRKRGEVLKNWERRHRKTGSQPGGILLAGFGTAGIKKQNNANEASSPTVVLQKNRRFVNAGGMLA